MKEFQTLNERKALAIHANLEKVEEAIAAVNALLHQGMDWLHIEKLIESERKRGNAVAEIIAGLKLKEEAITLLLAEEGTEEEDSDKDSEGDESEEEEEETDDEEAEGQGKRAQQRKEQEARKLRIDVDLKLSGWANSREYYVEKKSAAVKEEKTIQSSSKALKSTERKVLADLKKGLNKEKQLLRPVRQQLWFEKFYFFISSDGYLVLG